MRYVCSVVIALALAGLAPAFAANQTTIKEGRDRYTSCSCHFGYGNSCQTTIACSNEGGRCSGSCVIPREGE
jgi:hypothetical protein